MSGWIVNEFREIVLSTLDADSALGQTYLGWSHERGFNGLAKDSTIAVRYYQLAAQQNYPLGQALLGSMYRNGLGGLSKDHDMAVHYYGLSAGQNHPLGQATLGIMYEQGFGGLSKDNVMAVHYYQLSAAQNHPVGQALLGAMYVKGLGVPKDRAMALYYYLLSAEQNHPVGQYYLGASYYRGLPKILSPDFSQSVHYLQLAAKQGHAASLITLGTMYQKGICGLTKDLLKAGELYQQAADQQFSDQGEPSAHKYLASLPPIMQDTYLTEKECAICMEQFLGRRQAAVLLSCGHVYHLDCLERCKTNSKLCPYCRRTIG